MPHSDHVCPACQVDGPGDLFIHDMMDGVADAAMRCRQASLDRDGYAPTVEDLVTALLCELSFILHRSPNPVAKVEAAIRFLREDIPQ